MADAPRLMSPSLWERDENKIVFLSDGEPYRILYSYLAGNIFGKLHGPFHRYVPQIDAEDPFDTHGYGPAHQEQAPEV